NPEGVQFIDHIVARAARDGWQVNDRLEVVTDRPADQLLASNYAHGDVFSLVGEATGRTMAAEEEHAEVTCKVGMATAGAVFKLEGQATKLRVSVPLQKELESLSSAVFRADVTWPAIRSQAAKLRVPNKRF